jgi:hypothetical protein
MINHQKINEHFNITFTIFLALLAGMILVFVVSIWLVQSDKFVPNTDMDNLFQILIPLVGLTAMFISRYLYKNQVMKVDKNSDIITKLNLYRTFKIISYALIEGAGFFALIGFMITENYLYVFVFVFLIGFLLMIRPSREGFVSDFKISRDETEHILRRIGRG